MKKIKVMIVDDSAVVRHTLRDILDADPAIEVVAMAHDAYTAAGKLKRIVPDVITLDIEMPRMDGVTFLKKIMSQHPIPVIVCSSHVGEGSETLTRVLEAGAVAVIEKPIVGTQLFLKKARGMLIDAVKSAAQVKLPKINESTQLIQPAQKFSADVIMKKSGTRVMANTTEKKIGDIKKIKVMIVDDSAVVRHTLRDILDADPAIEVVATAEDPYIAVEKLKHIVPDVITLDIEMPRMDGLTFLKKIMSQHPIPVIICSSYAGEGSETLMSALDVGAVDIIKKPVVGTQLFLQDAHALITDAVKSAAKIKSRKIKESTLQPTQKFSADIMLEKPNAHAVMSKTTEKIIVIGASTGGTKAISDVLEAMPLDCPGIVVVQHMPEGFTQSFANHLNSQCHINVIEAKHGDTVLRGQALIAPGNKHILIKRSSGSYYVEIKEGPLVSRHRPSVDVLFRSATRYAGFNAVAAILTGMGDDGAEGMKELFDVGAWTCAQDEASSVVYGMPKQALLRGGINQVLSLNKIAGALLDACK